MKQHQYAPTISVMTSMKRKSLGFIKWETEHWQTLSRADGLALFKEIFLASRAKLIVIEPDFSKFNPKFSQTYSYLPLARDVRTKKEDRVFFERCIGKLKSHEGAAGDSSEVAFIASRFLAEDGRGWTVPLAQVEHGVKLMSKRACVESILPSLAQGIGPDEGGIYAPYDGDGVMSLSSM